MIQLRNHHRLTAAGRAACCPTLEPGTRTCPECDTHGWALTFAAFEALPSTVRAAVNVVFWDSNAWRCADCLIHTKAPTTPEE